MTGLTRRTGAVPSPRIRSIADVITDVVERHPTMDETAYERLLDLAKMLKEAADNADVEATLAQLPSAK